MDRTKTLQFKAENNPLTETARNKNTTKTRYTDLGYSGGLYIRKLNIDMKSQEETGTETSSVVDSPQGGAAWGGPAPPDGAVMMVPGNLLACSN
jgi:hypothetical protein